MSHEYIVDNRTIKRLSRKLCPKCAKGFLIGQTVTRNSNKRQYHKECYESLWR
jgi:ribosomal protein S27AE